MNNLEEIIVQLKRIADALEGSATDFSAEDSVVLGMTSAAEEATAAVEEAQGQIPQQ